MSDNLNRRNFLKKSLAASPAAALALSFEEKALLAATAKKPAAKMPGGSVKGLPMGKIGNINISRIFCGGNLISGFAHSRDLIYVSSLLRKYFTDEKVMETFEICEETGINTAILRLDEHCIRIINKYWNNRGGKLQWIAQVKMPSNDPLSDAKAAIDNGAIGAYVHGGVADRLVAEGRADLLGKAVDFIKQNGVIAGMGGHSVEVPMACEKEGLDVDFYMKTLHSHKYWSADRQPENDNIWSKTPDKTAEFMRKVDKPWIAYKVMAAGAIQPKDAFKYAYENGADFICAGMFDFQVREDVILAKDALAGKINRQRPWRG
ncbi:MAG: hypothetical protein CEE38_19475 [Planctomycetes bacterium B3_Pla]|nr:MAG: hypothetical protein CEE38_19475 [Planctomycetes bacterium B3_Pla]